MRRQVAGRGVIIRVLVLPSGVRITLPIVPVIRVSGWVGVYRRFLIARLVCLTIGSIRVSVVRGVTIMVICITVPVVWIGRMV